MNIDANEVISELSAQIGSLNVQLAVANATIRQLQASQGAETPADEAD